MAIIYSCKDCSERHIGCHSECEKYKDCTNKSHEINDKRFVEHMKYSDVANAMERMRKRRRLK